MAITSQKQSNTTLVAHHAQISKTTKNFVRNYQRNMRNKPNSLNVQIYINIYDKKDYKNFIPLAGQKNKPNSNPIKPILNLNVKIAGQNPNCRYNNIVE